MPKTELEIMFDSLSKNQEATLDILKIHFDRMGQTDKALSDVIQQVLKLADLTRTIALKINRLESISSIPMDYDINLDPRD